MKRDYVAKVKIGRNFCKQDKAEISRWLSELACELDEGHVFRSAVLLNVDHHTQTDIVER